MSPERWMRRCLELARQAEGRTAPNPMVGCVLVNDAGETLAEGHHVAPGRDHAEVDALNKLPDRRAPGATKTPLRGRATRKPSSTSCW